MIIKIYVIFTNGKMDTRKVLQSVQDISPFKLYGLM